MKKSVDLHVPCEIQVATGAGEKEVGCYARFINKDSGKTLVTEGFEDGTGGVQIRYSLPEDGNWTYTVFSSSGSDPLETGEISCTKGPGTRYPMEIINNGVRPLFAKNGKPFFINTYECNWLFALWMKDEEACRAFLRTLKSYRFNGIAMNVYAHECFWTDPATPGRLVPPVLFNWMGSNDKPDFNHINGEFYSRFDRLIAYMNELDITAHLYFFVWNKANSYPEQGSKAERDYIQYIVRRYGAFPNIVWDYSKEAYLRIDKEHIRKMMQLIRDTDPYKRLLTIHDDKVIQYDQSFDSILDFYTMQIHHDYFSKTLREIEKGLKPVFTAEYTYESGAALADRTFQEAHSSNENIRVSWELALAGSPICYYYTYSAWDVIRPLDIPPGYAQFKFLTEYFDTFDWYNYSAVPELNSLVRTVTVCAKHVEKNSFVLMTDKRGRFGVLMDPDRYEIKGEWVDIYTGEVREIRREDISHQYRSQIAFGVCPMAEKYGEQGYLIARFELVLK